MKGAPPRVRMAHSVSQRTRTTTMNWKPPPAPLREPRRGRWCPRFLCRPTLPEKMHATSSAKER